MIEAVKRKLFNLIQRQDGFVLPAVLAMFVVGSLMILPSIDYVATNLNAGSMAKEEYKGILAADAGVEDALWKIKNDTLDPLPCLYQITGINGLPVYIDIDVADTIAGEPVGTGQHAEWLIATTNVTYDAGTGNYTYTVSVSNNTTDTDVHIAKILIYLPTIQLTPMYI